jgi:hypothetical protein
MRILLFVLLFLGLALIFIGFIRANRHCPPLKIQYRWVPRSFVEEQQSPVPVTDIFASMFYDSTAFINHESSKLIPPPNIAQHQIGKFFISAN